MIKRKCLQLVENKIKHFPAVALLGPRQVGKTTLARQIAKTRPSLYLDLENYQDLAKLEDPISYLKLHTDDARHGERSEGAYSAAGADFLPSVSERKKSLRAVESSESPCVVEP